MKKQMSWKTKGMNRDLSVSAFNPEFSFENMNLRLSTNEGNTLMSWVNEKGTAAIDIVEGYWKEGDTSQTSVTAIDGTPIGTAVINHQLVIFSKDTNSDLIYILKYADDSKATMLCKRLYKGNLGFDVEYPLETLVSYESESIQKVYWTDGINQPRVINIEGEIILDNNTQFDFVPELKLRESVKVHKMLGASGMFAPGVIQYAFTYYNKNGQESNIFYTTPLYYISHKDRGASPEDKVENAFKITVTNPDSNFDYLRIYSIQRTSINGTPIVKRIQDLSLSDLGSSSSDSSQVSKISSNSWPDLTVDGNREDIAHYSRYEQNMTISGITTECYGIDGSTLDVQLGFGNCNVGFGPDADQGSIIWVTKNKVTIDGVTAYWIFGTRDQSENYDPEDITVSYNRKAELSFTDTGTSGDSVDPTELLYKGGETISAETIEQKNNTLFLGNLKITRPNINSLKSLIQVDKKISQSTRKFRADTDTTGDYKYASQLSAYDVQDTEKSVSCAGFKYGDYYRCGVQFQYKTGKWSDPIYLDDVEIKNTPSINEANASYVEVTVPTLSKVLSAPLVTSLYEAGYRKARAVVVYPSIQDRVSICQGVTCPTMYTTEKRDTDKSLYAQSSWFFRSSSTTATTTNGTIKPTNSGYLEYTSSKLNYNPNDTSQPIRKVEIQGEFDVGHQFRVDTTFLTLHSPDIEFDDSIYSTNFIDMKYRKMGEALIKKTLSDIDIQTSSPTVSNSGGGFVHKSFSSNDDFGIVSGLFYDDYCVDDRGEDDKELMKWNHEHSSFKYMVYAWNKNGSLNNDINRPANQGTPTAVLKKKVISNLRYTSNAPYNPADKDHFGAFENNTTPQLFASDQTSVVKVGDCIYQGNIDTMLVPDTSDGVYFAFGNSSTTDITGSGVQTAFTAPILWKTFSKDEETSDDQGIWRYASGRWSNPNITEIGNTYVDLVRKKEPVRMKYKSSPHIAFKIPTWQSIPTTGNSALPIIDIVREIDTTTIFGGKTDDALKENIWLPCGEPVSMVSGAPCTIEYSYGDTYYQRYDCLKTYAFTKEDINQIVEIGSFMLETRVNIDGRYDRNRGQVNNLNMSPQNFNLLNMVYTQQNNFFTYRIQDDDFYKDTVFPNQITWSKTKESGAVTDMWTNVTLASILELDGNKGEVTSLQRLNDNLICFQDSGISQILYDENVQISSTSGVPIEIANSGKVQGKRYLSDTVGCSNKWSITNTPAGIYFIDNNDKSIYQLGEGLKNISQTLGFNPWCKNNIPAADNRWTPERFNDFVSYYDKLNQDILFINKDTALAFSERMATFTSFYDYGNIPFFSNLDDTGIWLKGNQLWKHQAGDYCKFFGVNKPYWMTLVGNPEPQLDKQFTNIELRANVGGDGWIDFKSKADTFDQTFDDTFHPGGATSSYERVVFYLPFTSLEVWNEHQHGFTKLDNRFGRDAHQHFTSNGISSLLRKFRIWRCDIPRNNCLLDRERDASVEYPYSTDLKLGISRLYRKPIDRMRNTWLYLKFMKDAAAQDSTMSKIEIHDLIMTYYG